jgi:hypothetical protein
MSMYLKTQHLVVPEEPDPHYAPQEYGWPEVRNGLHSILAGYLISIGLVLLAAGVIAYLVYSLMTSQDMLDTVIDAAMILYLTWAVMIVGGLYSLYLVIRGKMKCLINAPERCGAKWLMFSSILFFVFGPALDILSKFVGSDAKSHSRSSKAVAALMQGMHDYSEALVELRPRAYLAVAGNLSNLMSVVLFVLFLRQVAHCFEDSARMRLAEFYLAFTALLLAGTVFLVVRLVQVLQGVPLPTPGMGQPLTLPPHVLRELQMIPMAALLLGSGWLLALVWYFLLIISTSMGIAERLHCRPRPV